MAVPSGRSASWLLMLLAAAGCGAVAELPGSDADLPDGNGEGTDREDASPGPDTAEVAADWDEDRRDAVELDDLDVPSDDVESGGSAVIGDIDGIRLDPTYSGVGNLWAYGSTGWRRYGQNVALADLPVLCDVMGSGAEPDDVYALAFWFWDTGLGTYAVRESVSEADIGARVVEVYLTGRRAGTDVPKRHAVSGEVNLASIVPTDDEPLGTGSTVAGSFTLVLIRNANTTVECMTLCGPDGCGGTCECERPDGTAFVCTTDGTTRSCCNDGVTERQSVTGWFEAAYCANQCACLGSDPGCPCFL